jgi:hypothetical protein
MILTVSAPSRPERGTMFRRSPANLRSPPGERALASALEQIATAVSFAANTGTTVRHGGYRAYYSISDDYVEMPTHPEVVGRARVSAGR